jgi:hypothetical protein
MAGVLPAIFVTSHLFPLFPPFFSLPGKKVQVTWMFVHFSAGPVAPPLYHQIIYNNTKTQQI